MIYICYGVTKSASTFLYQLTEEILTVSGQDFGRIAQGGTTDTSNYYDAIDPPLLERIAQAANGRPVVLKTHGDIHPGVAARITSGEILVSASIRDPREIALSMADHGARARATGKRAFSEVQDPLDTLPAIDLQLDVFERWAAVPGVEVFTYNEICFDTEATVQRVATQMGLVVDAGRVMAPFRSGAMIGQFNIGQPARYRDMPQQMQDVFLERYAAFYARTGFGDAPAAGSRRPVGAAQAKVAGWRRLLRRLFRSRHLRG
ncbi:hypothetical protein ACLBXM_11330 [Xanthobacteraceae bacterium A53D]